MSWRAVARTLGAIPVLLLLGVAASQLWLAHRSALTPWLGGGFGMFSTLDALAARHLHVFLWTAAARMEVVVPEHRLDLVDRALALPSDSNLRELAQVFAGSGAGDLGSVERVEIQVFGRRYHPLALEPEGVLIRALEVRVVEP